MSLEADQFTQLMDKMAGIEAKVASKLDKFQHDMEASQASSLQEVGMTRVWSQSRGL